MGFPWSGHVVTEQGEDWGRVLIVTGMHHDVDREDQSVARYGGKIAAWETVTQYTFSDGVILVHDCGQILSDQEKAALVECVVEWGKDACNNDYLFSKIVGNDDAYRALSNCANLTVKQRQDLVSKITNSYAAFRTLLFRKSFTAKQREMLIDRITSSRDACRALLNLTDLTAGHVETLTCRIVNSDDAHKTLSDLDRITGIDEAYKVLLNLDLLTVDHRKKLEAIKSRGK